MELAGNGVKDPNYIFRLILIVSIGVIGLGFIVFYNSQDTLVTDYQDMPTTKFQREKKKENRTMQLAGQNELLKKELQQ